MRTRRAVIYTQGSADDGKTTYDEHKLDALKNDRTLHIWAAAVSFDEAVSTTTQALAIDDASVKALYRRGMGRIGNGDYAEAKADLRRASELDPKSKEVREGFNECVKKESAAKKGEKALYGRMFG